MAIYNITNNARTQLETRINDTKASLETRRALWVGLSPEKRAQWKVSCPDPIIDLLWKLYQFLKEFFGEA